LARRINEVCNRFELAWQAGPRPRLEDFLSDTPEPERSVLLRELIALDLDYRRRAGEKPTAEEYRERFPAWAPPAEVSTVLDSPGPADGAATPDPELAGAARAGRYQLGDEIGHGGMGAVLQGHDPELDRDLAIKVLREDHLDQPGAVQRFLEEARIAGRLQHPGIVPIYDLGRFPDRRPFFAMKLVQGCTLADLLKERPNPAHDLPRFLKIFEQVCQTLAYAHSRGVIHRDLKPSNVMVGAFGEVQVMDWGLAKVLRPTGEKRARNGEGELSTAPGSGSASLSRLGQVMGTPAYMPPEQARGEVGGLDERCDVFGLGAILCVILTGKPPYRGERGKVLNSARRADQADALARLDSCGADADLVYLAKVCLQPQAEDRPCNAAVVAEQVTAYLVGVQERLRQAEVERAAAQAREEEARARAEAEAQARRAERRARQRTLALAVSLLLLLSSVGAAGWWYQQQQAARELRQEQTAGEVKVALREVAQLRERALTQLDNPESWKATLDAAGSAVKRAEALLQQEPQLAGTALAQEVQQSRAELEADAKDHQLVTAFEKVRFKLSEFDRRYVESGAYQDVRGALAQWGLPLTEVPTARATSLVQQRPRGMQDRLVAILHSCLSRAPRAEQKPRAWLWEVLAAADPDPWRQRVRQAVADADRGLLEKLVDQTDVARQPPSFLVDLAREPLLQGKVGRIGLLRRAQQQHPGDFWVNFDLGAALRETVFGRGGAARPARAEELPVVNEVVAFLRVAVGLRPGNAPAHTNLGAALQEQGDLKGAITCYKKALDLDPKYASAHTNLGLALLAQGDVQGAIACYKQALNLDAKYALVHNNLGNALQAQGDVKGAIACFKKALDLDPKYAPAHNNLGQALQAQGDLKGAIACYHKGIDLDCKLAPLHTNLGAALQAQGDLKGAIACYRKALALDPKDAPAHTNLGLALQAQRDLKGAIASFKKALALDPKDAKAHYALGLALQAQGDLKGASACFKKALGLDPKDVKAHNNLGTALSKQGDMQGAIACYRKALDLDPKYALAHYNLGNALQAQKDLKGAIACYRKALALEPKNARTYSNLGTALYAQKDWKGAIACYRKALDLEPKYAPVHTNLGNALQAQGDLQGAIACFTKALELDPKHARAHTNLGIALQAQGDLKGAIQCFRKAIALDPKLAPSHYNLGQALYDQKDWKGAIACYHKALQLDPKLVQAHGALGQALLAQGAFQEARAASQQALDLLPDGHALRPLATRQLHECQRLLDLHVRLTAILAGDDQPKDTAEQLALADLCQHYKKRFVAAVRFYAAGLADELSLPAPLQVRYRYNAACAAALAAAGKGEDAGKLDAKEQSRLRQQALSWLRDNLKRYGQQLEGANAKTRTAVQQTLQHWQKDADLASVRGKALAQLPESERAPWQQLWAEVTALLKRAAEPK
jgi:tetratricopeptide (TPR) repeat protein